MSIKYHQYGLGYEYGEDHALTNNWNPDEDYGNEYSNVYFNIDTPAYDGMNGGWKADERETIGKEIDRLFTSLGWKCMNQDLMEYVLHIQKVNHICICTHRIIVAKY